MREAGREERGTPEPPERLETLTTRAAGERWGQREKGRERDRRERKRGIWEGERRREEE